MYLYTKMHLVLAVKHGNMSHVDSTGFKDIKESWRTTEAWHYMKGLKFLKDPRRS